MSRQTTKSLQQERGQGAYQRQRCSVAILISLSSSLSSSEEDKAMALQFKILYQPQPLQYQGVWSLVLFQQHKVAPFLLVDNLKVSRRPILDKINKSNKQRTTATISMSCKICSTTWRVVALMTSTIYWTTLRELERELLLKRDNIGLHQSHRPKLCHQRSGHRALGYTRKQDRLLNHKGRHLQGLSLQNWRCLSVRLEVQTLQLAAE